MIKDGEVKIGDLGLVSHIKRHERQTGMTAHSICTGKSPLSGVGTFLYMAPEAIDQKSGTSADVWATACIALFSITKKHPYAEEYQRGESVLLKI